MTADSRDRTCDLRGIYKSTIAVPSPAKLAAYTAVRERWKSHPDVDDSFLELEATAKET